MIWLLNLLSGKLGPFVAGGVAVLVAGLVLTAGIQSARLSHAKADLGAARLALIDPVTKRTWQVEAEERFRDLTTCRDNTKGLQASLDRQSAATVAAAAEGRTRTAAAEKAVQAARGATERAERAATSILNHQPVGIDTCARVLDVDQQFTEALK